MALMPNLLVRCFSLFLPHFRTLAQEKRSEICLRFVTSGPSLCLYPLLSQKVIFSPMASRAKKKICEAICSRHQRALSGILRTLMFTEFDCVALLAML